MMQQVVNGSEVALQGKALEALENVKALRACLGNADLKACQGDKGLLTFRSDDLLTGDVVLIDWDQDAGMFRMRDYAMPNAAPIVDWCNGYQMLVALSGPKVGYAYLWGRWVDEDEREEAVLEQLERKGAEFEDKLGIGCMEYLQVGEYLPAPQQVSDHVMRVGSICL